jgi:hypothetical protein
MVERIKNSAFLNESGAIPMATFWVQPNRSPLDIFGSEISSTGSRPAGPGDVVRTEYSEESPESRTASTSSPDTDHLAALAIDRGDSLRIANGCSIESD